MPTHNVNLPDHQSKFIRKSVKRGRYKNASEVVRAGLRLLEQQEAEEHARLTALQRVAHASFAALDRGQYTSFTPSQLDTFFTQIDRRLRRS